MANRTRPVITEDLQGLNQRLRKERDPERKRRLQMLALFKSDSPPTRKQVAEHLAVSRNTIARWLSWYESGGIDRLLTNQQAGRKPGQRLLPQPVLSAVERRLNDHRGFGSYLEVQQWLASEFGLEVNYKSLHGLLRYRLQAKLKAPRPEHPKKV
jgi:transposase